MCSDTASVRIRFVPAAIPTALSDVTNPICVGDTINLMSSVAGLGTNGSTYLWTGDRVNSPTDSITFARPFTVGTAGYVVSITTPLGCTVRDTVLIYVKGVLPNLQPLLDSTTLCQNGSTQITAITAFDPAAGDPDAIYNWSPGIGLSDSTIANPFFSYVPGQPLQQTYTLLVSSGGCPDSSQTTITYVPDVTVTLAVDDDKICVGDTIWLNPVITPSGVPGAAISWEGEGINDPTAISTFALPMTKGIKEYKFRLVLGTDCIDSVSVQVNVEGVTPVITNIGAGNSPLCFGDSTTISADVNPEFTTTPSNILHTWSASNSNGGIVNPLADSTVIKPTETTTYTLTASDGGYCIVDSSITVEVGAPLDFSFDLTFSPDSLSPVPVSVTFTANITTTGPVDSVYWILTDLNNPDAPTIYLDGRSGSATYEFTTNAQYDVVMYVHTPNCPVRSTTRPLWIGAFVVPNVITPNGDGVNDVFMIPNLKPNSTVHIFNRWGKELKTFGPTENWAPDAELPGGIYFYSVDERNTGRIYKGWLELMR
ncbi:MAG: gliding motility-associated C-terminal domain-containing protein [Sphingobacteriales bacterium]|nr:MAG: gliding motility-associated C-terminal domain-containing protein [Sphingobacteriales bacterium]